MAQITYEDKITMNSNSSIPAKNKCQASDMNEIKNVVNANWNGLLDLIYPIGSIYMSTNSVSPATIIGGTWVQLEDRFLLGAGSTYTAGSTGGTATETLTINQIPSHRHMNDYYYPAGDQQFYTDTGSGLSGTGNKYIYLGGSVGFHGAQTHSNVGGGQAHNNMPPYSVVYMWERTA